MVCTFIHFLLGNKFISWCEITCANKRSCRKKGLAVIVYCKAVAELCRGVPSSNNNDAVYQ